MNFKIELNSINITNYPSLEKHFETMAKKGWLINRIFAENFFIYKKIQPESLDFSISPYEVETMFTRKTKKELEEFQTVCINVGWNFALKYNDFHIYFKEEDDEATDLETDAEEEFNTLEKLGKKYNRVNLLLLATYLIIGWTLLKGIFSSVFFMKDGLGQLLAPIIPLYMVLNIKQLININRFLKINRENVELGQELEYKESQSHFDKIVGTLIFIALVAVILDVIYMVFVLKDTIALTVFGLILIGGLVGSLYRIFIKPSRMGINYKIVLLVIFFIAIITINTAGLFNVIGSSDYKEPNIKNEKVLSANDFTEKSSKEEKRLRAYTSPLLPKSYDYTSINDYGYMRTEYSRALSEGLAKNLVNRYKRESTKELKWRYSSLIEDIIKEDHYDESVKQEYNNLLEYSGINEEYLANMNKDDLEKAKKQAMNLIINKNITNADLEDINVDEAYFLNYEKDEIVIRIGKEVYCLNGADFSKPEIIKIVKEKLDL